MRAVCGNCDVAPLSVELPRWRREELGGHRILILHKLGEPERLTADASARIAAERPNVVISGHSHQGRIVVRDGVLFLNPGSAGRKRFRLLRSAALLSLTPHEARATLFSLEAGKPTAVAHGSCALRSDSAVHVRLGRRRRQPACGKTRLRSE